jgi:hypothetical protein
MPMRDLTVVAMAVAACAAACNAGCAGSHGTTSPPGDTGVSDGNSGPLGDAGQPGGDAGQPVGALRIDAQNPRYFTTGNGKVVYLTGSHTWGNFKDRAHVDPPPAFDYSAFLDFLTAHHHNFLRLWTWEQPHSFDDDPQNLLYFAQFPWKRTGPDTASDGKPKFDLAQLEPAYFTRLRDRVVAARDRGIYVSVMLFDGWDLANAYNAKDGGFPFAAGNNVNGIAATGPQAITLAKPEVTALQEAYVRAVIDAVNDLDNVLYEIANETDATAVAWQYHMIDLVKSIERGKPHRHPVGMTSVYPGGSDADLLNSHADWISPVGRLVAGDGHKVILNDTDHSYGWQTLQTDGPAAQRAWAWETLCIGAAPLFMDPYLEPWAGRNNPTGGRPDPSWDTVRDALGRTRAYAERLDLERAVPSAALCSTGYCLAEPGHQYLIYKPPTGAVTFTVTMVAGAYAFEWYNPATGAVSDTGTITLPAGAHRFTPPFSGDAVLLLLAP